MSETLKPCPFCGSVAELRSEGKHHFVACTDEEECGVEGHRARVYDYAIETWNYRTAAEQVRAPSEGDVSLLREAKLTRPIIGIENRTPQEAFDIMCDRIRSALTGASAVEKATPFEQSGLYGEYTPVTIGPMGAREVIATSTHSHACDGGYSVVGGAAADAVISALTAAGYRILAPGELDQVTLEKAAEVAEAHAGQTDFDLEPEAAVAEAVTAKSIAAEIRALNTGGE